MTIVSIRDQKKKKNQNIRFKLRQLKINKQNKNKPTKKEPLQIPMLCNL